VVTPLEDVAAALLGAPTIDEVYPIDGGRFVLHDALQRDAPGMGELSFEVPWWFQYRKTTAGMNVFGS
jgi:hypothetical protein